jgi:SAM-dependent methyltransferase
MGYLDHELRTVVDDRALGTVAEICCGRGEAFQLLGSKIGRGVGVDVSIAMLKMAQTEHAGRPITFLQGDATMLPLASAAFDSVFMLGGIHHVNDRRRLFAEIARILKPGGRLYFREPVSDFALWRWLRAAIYRISPTLDHDTERPLRYNETVPFLAEAGLSCEYWATHGFVGFCLFMNSDVLLFNRLFRFIPGIRAVTRWSVLLDKWTGRIPGMRRAGLQVVGVALLRDSYDECSGCAGTKVAPTSVIC